MFKAGFLGFGSGRELTDDEFLDLYNSVHMLDDGLELYEMEEWYNDGDDVINFIDNQDDY